MDAIGLVYAATVLTGGIIGYATKGSVASLGAGVAFGGLTGFAAYSDNAQLMLGWKIPVGAGLLAAVMGYRFVNSHKFMPAGLVFVLSVLMLGRTLYRLTQ